MCFAVFIGTSKPQVTGTFIPNQTALYLLDLTEEETDGLKAKFTKPYLYYVGSDTSCSCGFDINYENFDPREKDDTKSPLALIEFIKARTQIEDLEFYCCWDGDWNEVIEERREIDIREVSLENYFGLIEREFILFKKREF
jgi:hypothetical protein